MGSIMSFLFAGHAHISQFVQRGNLSGNIVDASENMKVLRFIPLFQEPFLGTNENIIYLKKVENTIWRIRQKN